MESRFDKLYEEMMNDRIDEWFLSQLFQNTNEKKIAYDFLLFAGNTTDSDVDKTNKLRTIYMYLSKYSKNLKKLLVFYKKHDNVELEGKQILKILDELINNKVKRYKLHKEIRDEQANKQIQEFFGKEFNRLQD